MHAVLVSKDLSVYVGGTFRKVAGKDQVGLAHFFTNGNLDYDFVVNVAKTGSSADVMALAAGPNGKLLVGGDFTSINGVEHNDIAQLNTDGSLDTEFVATTDGAGAVKSLGVEPDGMVLAAGSIQQFNQIGQAYLARLHGEQPDDTMLAEVWVAVEIGWNTEPLKHYQVQWADEVDSAYWYDLGDPVDGTGQMVYVFDSVRASGPQKYYRAKRLD